VTSALRQGDYLHVRIGHALVEAGDVLLVTRQAIHRFRQHELEAAARRIANQGLDAGTQKRCAGNGVVGIFLDHLPALLLSMKAADAELAGN
jgi:hypothetical protein